MRVVVVVVVVIVGGDYFEVMTSMVKVNFFCSRSSYFFAFPPISHPKFSSGWDPSGSITIHSQQLTGLTRFLFRVGSVSLGLDFSSGWDLWTIKKIFL